MNIYEVLKLMNATNKRCYAKLEYEIETENGTEIVVYTARYNPCWFADVFFYEEDRKLTHAIPNSILLNDNWELVIVDNNNQKDNGE